MEDVKDYDHGDDDDDDGDGNDDDDDDEWRPRDASGRVSAAGRLRSPSYWRSASIIIVIVKTIFSKKVPINIEGCFFLKPVKTIFPCKDLQ